MTILDLSRKIIRAIISLVCTLVLIENTLYVVMIMLLALTIIEVLVSIRLYTLVAKSKEEIHEKSNNRNSSQTLC